MNSSQEAGTNAGQMASSEAKAAGAADFVNMEVEDSNDGYEYNSESPLTDYNEDDPIPALKKSNNGKEAVFPRDRETKKLALREKLA